MRPYDLKDYEVLTALRFFCYHMQMEQRDQLMSEFPVIYNKLMGSEIVVSVGKNMLSELERKAAIFASDDDDDAEMDALMEELGVIE